MQAGRWCSGKMYDHTLINAIEEDYDGYHQRWMDECLSHMLQLSWTSASGDSMSVEPGAMKAAPKGDDEEAHVPTFGDIYM